MNKKSLLPLLGILIFSSFFFLSSPKKAQANVFDDIFNGIKQVFTPASQQLSVSSKISLASNDDLNNDEQYNAGDTLRFTYVITNTTDKTFPFVTLKTNVNSNNINSIHNIHGIISILNTNHVITIPNINVKPHHQITISFDATSNFNKNTDQNMSTEPELLAQDNNTIGKGSKIETTIHKLNTDVFNKLVHITK